MYVAPITSTYFPERLPPNNHFTKEEKKEAKRNYKERQQMNPAGFKNSRSQFRANFRDRLSTVRRLKFNLVSISDKLN